MADAEHSERKNAGSEQQSPHKGTSEARRADAEQSPQPSGDSLKKQGDKLDEAVKETPA